MRRSLSVLFALAMVALLIAAGAVVVAYSVDSLDAYCSDSGGATDSGARHVNAAFRSIAYTSADDEDDWIGDFLCDIRVTDVALAACAFFLVAIGAWQGVQLSRAVAASRSAARAAQQSADATRLLVERLTARGGSGDRNDGPESDRL